MATCTHLLYRAPTYMPEAISRRRAASAPLTSPNGTGTIGPRWVREWAATSTMFWRWRCPAPTFMQGAIFRRRAASAPLTLPNGMGTVGLHWVREQVARWRRWRYRAVRYMWAATSQQRAMTPMPTTSRNGMGPIGRHWVRE